MRSSLRLPGATCACAVPIIPTPICPYGWKESFLKNGKRPLFFFKHEDEAKGPEAAIRFGNWPIQ